MVLKLSINNPKKSTPTTKLTLPYNGQLLSSRPNYLQPTADGQDPYADWKTDPSPGNTSRLLSHLQPAIDKSLYRYVGKPDPLMRAKAKRLVIDSLGRYDPNQSKLETFIDRQIQPIVRWQSRRSQVVKMPDKVRMQAIAIGRATRELEREHGREPSVHQIADFTGLPVRTVERIQNTDRRTLAGSMTLGNDADGDQIYVEDQGVYDDQAASDAWLRFIRDDLTPIDQKILDHTTGLGGAVILKNRELAARLKLSPGAVSQRKAKIQTMIDRQDDLSVFQ